MIPLLARPLVSHPVLCFVLLLSIPMEGAQGCGSHLPEPMPLQAMPAKGPNESKRDEWSVDGVVFLLEVYEAKWLLCNRAKLKGSN